MAIQIKDVKVEVNRPKVDFDTLKLAESEKKTLQKKKALLAATTVLTVGAALTSKILKAKKKTKK